MSSIRVARFTLGSATVLARASAASSRARVSHSLPNGSVSSTAPDDAKSSRIESVAAIDALAVARSSAGVASRSPRIRARNSRFASGSLPLATPSRVDRRPVEDAGTQWMLPQSPRRERSAYNRACESRVLAHFENGNELQSSASPKPAFTAHRRDAKAERRRYRLHSDRTGGDTQRRYPLSVPAGQSFLLAVRFSGARSGCCSYCRCGGKRLEADPFLPGQEPGARNLGRLSLRSRRRARNLRV